jgi:hypothetical protein
MDSSLVRAPKAGGTVLRYVFVSLVVVSSVAVADEKNAGPPKQQPPEVKQTVNAVLGKWSGKMTAVLPGEEDEKFIWTVTCETAALGAGASCVQEGKASIGKLAESCLIAYDASSKSVHKMCVGSMGEVHDHKGYWKDKMTIEFEPLHGTMQGHPIVETVSMKFPDPRTMINTSVVVLSDGRKMSFEFTGKRE